MEFHGDEDWLTAEEQEHDRIYVEKHDEEDDTIYGNCANEELASEINGAN